MHAARAQPGKTPLADQQPGRRGLLLLRERTSQRIALLPGARAHCISAGWSAAQQRGCVSLPTTAAAPARDAMHLRGFIQSLRPRQRQCLRYCEAERFRGLRLTTSSSFTVCWTGKPGCSIPPSSAVAASENWARTGSACCSPGAAAPARVLGRRTNALTNFFANLGIVLCHLQNGVVFLQREALISNCLRQGIDGVIRNALLVGGCRRGYPLLIILLETGHPLYGGCHRIELLVRNIRRLVGETGRRRLDLSVCCGNGEKPHGN